MNSGETWYEILEISDDANTEEIRLAYFDQARQYHPDTNTSKIAREWFFQIQEAYEVLSDPEKRKRYDESIKSKRKPKTQAELSIICSSNEISRLPEAQIIYVMLVLKSLVDMENIKPKQSHLCLLVDCSTSMKGSRIEMVKENITRLIHTLKPTDLISIIIFNDKAELLLTPTQVKEIDQIGNKLNNIKCSGGTEIFNGLKTGFDLLWESTSSETIKQILLLTDGHTYGDEEGCYELAQKLQTRGIKLSTLGIGHEWNDEFLDRLAGMTGGNSTFISTPDDLKEYVNQLVESVSVIASSGVSLDFQSEPGVKFNSIFRLQPDVAELALEKPIPLGDIYHGKKSSYLLTFIVDPMDKEKVTLSLMKGKIRFETVIPVFEKAKLFVNLVLSINSKQNNENPPKEIIEALSGINVYQMQEKANLDVKSGNLAQAIDRLGYISTRLLKLGKPSLAKMALKEAEMLKSNKKYSVDGDKQLKYGTRALLTPKSEKRVP